MGHTGVKMALAGAVVVSLSGCLGDGTGEGNFVSRLASSDQIPGIKASGKAQTTSEKISAESVVIQELASRRSALPANGPYDEVASAVLAANSRAAETELRAAKLRAEAASKNWLPSIGPDVSLTSLSSIVASLVLDVTLFDHGRKKAERAFAAADVEVAAVTLAEDSNDRVEIALGLYLAAEQGRETVALNETTLKDMNQFLYIMTERVRGGVSDMSDLTVIRQKVGEIRSSLGRNQEATRTALAELNAMSVHPLDSVRGLSQVRINGGSARPLQVVMADAERTRTIAQARVSRADQLPGVSAQARIGDDDTTAIRTDGTVGFGTGSTLKAIEASKEAADRDVARSQEDAAREIARLESQISALDRQAAEAVALTKAAKSNLDLFQQQFESGQRQVIDVVQVYETFARQEESQIELKYEAAAARIELARVLGLLADGEAI